MKPIKTLNPGPGVGIVGNGWGRTITWDLTSSTWRSWVVISGVISPLIWVITIVILLISLLITTHEFSNRVETALVSTIAQFQYNDIRVNRDTITSTYSDFFARARV